MAKTILSENQTKILEAISRDNAICQIFYLTGWKIEDLIKKAKIKFDWHIDYLQLGSQFLLAETVKDYPRMILKLENEEWQKFFIDQSKSFSGKIIA